MSKIAKKYKSFKAELFFIKRLLAEGYGPRYWWPYVKNRFFGRFLLSRLPRYEYTADPEVEMHTICQKKDIWMMASMLRSFFFYSNLRPKVIIHDDGSFDYASAKLLENKFSNLEVWLREDRTKRVLNSPDLPEIVRKARIEGHPFLYRPIDVLVLSKAKKLIFHDSDIIYYKPPIEIIDFITGKIDCDGLVQKLSVGSFDLMMDEYFNEKYKPNEKGVQFINGGYVILNGDKFRMDMMVEYLNHTLRSPANYFSEMGFFASSLAHINFKFLPTEKYVIKWPLNDNVVMKHYTSPRRYEMFAYGMDVAKKAMEKAKRGVDVSSNFE